MPLTMQTYLHQALSNGNFPVRKIGRLHSSDKIRLFELREPYIFLRLRVLIARDDFIESSRNGVLGFN